MITKTTSLSSRPQIIGTNKCGENHFNTFCIKLDTNPDSWKLINTATGRYSLDYTPSTVQSVCSSVVLCSLIISLQTKRLNSKRELFIQTNLQLQQSYSVSQPFATREKQANYFYIYFLFFSYGEGRALSEKPYQPYQNNRSSICLVRPYLVEYGP